MTVSAREGGQTVNVSEAPASGLQRRYKITSADAKPVVESATVVDLAFGWTVFPLDGQVNGKTGQVVTVVDCTVNGSYARAKGEAVLPAPLPSKPTGIQVTPMGWFFVRGVAMVFDKYLQADRTRARFSKII